MTFVDIIIGVSIMLMIFLAIFGAFQLAIELVYSTKAKAGGMALVSQQLEYVRGLPYETIGTVGGIPSGPVPQLATTSINNIVYTVRTLVLYTDAPEDGTGGSDSTGVTADYKTIKVESTWAVRSSPRSTFAVTRVSPRGVETLTAGGTLRINVFDALSAPLPDASVRVRNASTSPAIDLTIESDAQGTVLIPGAPPASNYWISVTKGGYSTASTYAVTVANPNPNPGHLAVANAQTTTGSFFIDRTGELRIATLTPPAAGTFSDSFANQASLFATSSATVAGGALLLTEDESGYAAAGDAYSISVSPSTLDAWDTLAWTTDTPTNTAAAVQLYYLSNGSYVLVPDGALAGNSAGLTSGSASLATLATSTYPALRIKGLLTTTDASSTPAINSWSIGYAAGPAPLPSVDLSVRGGKTIGTAVGGTPIYKYTQGITTDQYGEWLLTPIEWDSYVLSLVGSTYTIFEQCPYPLSVAPGESRSVALQLTAASTHSLRVVVTAGGSPLNGAAVAITGPASASGTSSSCGQKFFGGLASGTYTLSVTASGYQPSSQSVSVSDTTVIPVALNP